RSPSGVGGGVGGSGAGTLDRSSPLPLWAQLTSDLRGRLAAGEFQGRFPTDAELTDAYRVSRHTVREAVGRLRADGLLQRERGRGTFLVHRQLEHPLPGQYSLARTIVSQGLDEASQVLACLVGPVGEHQPEARPWHRGAPGVAAELDLGAGEMVVVIERLRLADGQPVALDRSWLPAAVARPLVDADLTRGSIYDLLATLCRAGVTGGHERIQAVNPGRQERRLLGLPPRAGALAVARTALAGDRPVEHRRSLVRGDRYIFDARW
ncbi:MAG: GntR family transcriptional regulator, partial [Acidimicrobiales bacterium]